MSAGVQAGFGLSNFSYRLEFDEDNYYVASSSDTLIGFGAFFDATYVRLYLEYAMSLGTSRKQKTFSDGEEDVEDADAPDNYAWSMLNILLLGKYPIALGSVTVWPAAGILYSMTLSINTDGDEDPDDLADHDINDIFLSAGGGVDIDITSQIYVTLCALFHWNLTPNPIADYEKDEDYTETFTNYIISAYVGGGYKF
jgi:hypothetical protein